MIEEKTEVHNGLTLGGLIQEYRTHKASTFHKLAYEHGK